MSEKLDITTDTANIEKIIEYTKILTPIYLKMDAKCIHSWKSITYQNPSHEEIRILTFPLVSKTKTSYPELSRSTWFTSKVYKCSREKYFQFIHIPSDNRIKGQIYHYAL